MSYKIFCDLDGVLADFNRGVFELTSRMPEDYNTRTDDAWMWRAIAKAPGFYANLALMPDALELWRYLLNLGGAVPSILTGLPTSVNAAADKRDWVFSELGPSVPVIVCKSKEKILRAWEVTPPGDVPLLIDDMVKFQSVWEEGCGKFILHTSAAETIAKLQEVGL